MSRAVASAADIHPHDRGCAACAPYAAEPAPISAADRFGMLTVAGMGAGLVLSWVVDRLIGGPGISVMWGA